MSRGQGEQGTQKVIPPILQKKSVMRIPSFAPSQSSTADSPAPAPATDLLPPLHTSGLTPSQRAYLAQNPKYVAQLRSLENLYTQVCGLKSALRLRELGKLPDFGQQSSGPMQQELQVPRRECERLERDLWRWDGEIAGLAEALLARPVFGVGEEVVWRDAAWWWRVPEGAVTLPRRVPKVEETAPGGYGLSSFPSPKLTWRITKFFQRSPSRRSKLKRRQSTRERTSQESAW